MKQSIILYSLLIICISNYPTKSQAFNEQKICYFDLCDVVLLESPFKKAQELDKAYLLEMKADRLLAPYLREAGLAQKAESYTNWENTGLDGHIGGHYVSALALMFGSTGDKQIEERLDYMLLELKHCQDANGDGYLGGVPDGKSMWKEIARGDIRAGKFDLNGKWVPLYNLDKMYSGMRDAYLFAGKEVAKEILVKMTDWMIELVKDLSDDQIENMLQSEFGGLNEVFADVAFMTGDANYLKLAKQFSHKAILNPLLNQKDELTGLHANTQIPKVIGYKRISEVEHNDSLLNAASFFWDQVVEYRTVSIGGNSAYEHFHPSDNFSRMIKGTEGPETCNTYNMLRLSKMLYRTSLDKKYMDYYERALYNHILSSQHPRTGGLVYFTQMRPEHYRVYSQPHTSMWCCVGSGIENHAKYGEAIYAYTDNELYVNLFIPSRLNWKDKKVEVIQKNNFPEEDRTELIINPTKKTAFTLKIRNPKWVDHGLTVLLNGKPYPIKDCRTDYITIARVWEKGDKVVVNLPMSVHVEQLPDKSNYYSFLYGPILLAAKTGTDDLLGLFADDSRGGHKAHGKVIPLKDVPIIVADSDKLESSLKRRKEPLTFHLSNLYPFDKFKDGLDLIPFYKLHESRYIIYWPQATKEGIKEIQQKMELEEHEQLILDNMTVDYVLCGQQQPESDHFIKQENSIIDFSDDVYWRDSSSWFSYEFKNPNKVKNLYIQYLNQKNRKCDIYIDGKYLSSIMHETENDENLLKIIIPLPESEQNKNLLTIMFRAKEGVRTPRISEVRLLNQ